MAADMNQRRTGNLARRAAIYAVTRVNWRIGSKGRAPLGAVPRTRASARKNFQLRPFLDHQLRNKLDTEFGRFARPPHHPAFATHALVCRKIKDKLVRRDDRLPEPEPGPSRRDIL